MAKNDPTIETVAGNTGLGEGVPAVSTLFRCIAGIAVDAAGNLYIADAGGCGIRKVDASTGNISTVIGGGTNGLDGRPGAVALDVAGNLYIANEDDCCIHKMDAATGNISIVAGTAVLDGGFGGDGGPATSAMLSHPKDVAWDTAGNLYIADTYNHRIRKVDASTGIISTVAGTGTEGFGGDGGPATSAMLDDPEGIAFDGAGNLHIADEGNYRIRKVDASTGIISTVAGTGTEGFGGDGGPATSAMLGQPGGITFDGAGNLYIGDGGNHRIRKVDAATGDISTVAGTGRAGFSGDGGLATAATLKFPGPVACDSAGNLFVVDGYVGLCPCHVRKIDASTRRISTVAGGLGDSGPATSATISGFATVACDGAGNLYIADGGNHRIRKVEAATGNISTVAGTGEEGFGGDGGPATSAMLNGPDGVALDGAGNLYIADTGNHRIRKVDAATGNISTVAGTGEEGFGGDGGPATSAMLNGPNGIALDGAGSLYIADKENHRVRKVEASTGNIATVAGVGTDGFCGEGVEATWARLKEPDGVAVDGDGNLFIADRVWKHSRIRKVDALTGCISGVASLDREVNSVALTINGDIYIADDETHSIRKLDASTGNICTITDNAAATTALFDFDCGAAVDGAGSLYIADDSDDRILKVDAATGGVSIVAGTGERGLGGDGGLATSAKLNAPYAVAFDAADNLHIVDSGNHRIRKVDALTGNISTVAGTGAEGFGGDGGPATSAMLNAPHAVAFDAAGNLHIVDSGNHRIRKVDTLTGNISTVAGTGAEGFGGDGGPATSAMFNHPMAIALDGVGNLYIADRDNNRVRKVDASTGNVATVAGWGAEDDCGDGGPATSAMLNDPSGVALDAAGNLFIADTGNGRVRKVDASTGNISTVAVAGGSDGEGGPATSARLNVSGVALDIAGNLFIAGECTHRVWKVAASTGDISTVAGSGSYGFPGSDDGGFSGDGGPAASAMLDTPSGVALDAAGNLYIADERNDCIRRVDATTGNISTVAGTPHARADGGVAVDSAGNLYFADSECGCIRWVDASTGTVSVVVGRRLDGDDGPAAAVKLCGRAVALDAADNLHIADAGNDRVIKVDASTGNVSTVAGTGEKGFSGDGGPAVAAMLHRPRGVVFDAAGHLYIADRGNHRVRKVDVSTGNISTVAGTGERGFGGDGGPATSAMLADPDWMALDIAGNLYIADAGNYCIRKVDAATGDISTVAGMGTRRRGSNVSPPLSTMFDKPLRPEGLAVDTAGDLFIRDGITDRVLKVDAATGKVWTVAETEKYGGGVALDVAGNVYIADGCVRKVDATTGDISTIAGDGGPAAAAMLRSPCGVVFDVAGHLYIADRGNHCVRKVDASTGIISTVAGTGKRGFGGDGGRAVSTTLSDPGWIALDVAGNLYIADGSNHRIRKVDATTGIISTVAGTGEEGFGGDGGPAAAAMLKAPEGIALDISGNLYIADSGNTRVRKVDAPTGIISTVAGIGIPGFAGDGGPATAAMLNDPQGVALDEAGNLHIADAGHDGIHFNFGNHRIRKVDATTGIISTVAGKGSGDGGPATSATCLHPVDVALDEAGNVYIADDGYVRKVDAATGNISTVAGNGREDSTGDGGPAIQAMCDEPHSLTVDSAGNLYIAEWHRIRRVRAVDGPSVETAGTGGSKA